MIAESRLSDVYRPSLNAARSTLRDVEIRDSRLGAVDMPDAEVQSVSVTGSKLSWVNLRGAHLRDVLFHDCVFEELDLSQARVDRVRFRDCAVSTLRLDGAQLRNADLRGLHLSAVSGIESMRGAALSPEQLGELAPILASYLGIMILE